MADETYILAFEQQVPRAVPEMTGINDESLVDGHVAKGKLGVGGILASNGKSILA